MTSSLNHFEGEVIRLMRQMDADQQAKALKMMRRYLELLPEMSLPGDEAPERGGEDDE